MGAVIKPHDLEERAMQTITTIGLEAMMAKGERYKERAG